ncbi:MAG: glucose 1-dehydrogenase [Anaerolineae bacterium]|jgi:NAD(P)-dependent dehydrogenase (short-subunit alcohol dehydrogenase family)|nr:glucose 1-dehydrogenase [Anaerolineae bacterium]
MPETLDLAGRVALVTGASKGIGKATALELARRGAIVAVNYHQDQAGAEDTLRQMQQADGQGAIMQADIGNLEDSQRLLEACLAQYGRIDILVNNAAAFNRDTFLGVRMDDFDRLFDTNVRGLFRLSQLAAGDMVKRRAGAIVHISSILASLAVGGRTVYCATKGAVESLTRAMAIDLAPYGVRVNAIAPGMIRTDALLTGFSDPAAQQMIQSHIPGGRFGTPAELAAAVGFLVSDAASYISGVVLAVDYGMSAREAGSPIKPAPE